jgi:hypothetical protein
VIESTRSWWVPTSCWLCSRRCRSHWWCRRRWRWWRRRRWRRPFEHSTSFWSTFLVVVCLRWFGSPERHQCMDLNLACNLLNFAFETSNAISCQILHYMNSKQNWVRHFRGAGVGARPQFSRRACGAPKAVLPAPLPATNLGALVEMLLENISTKQFHIVQCLCMKRWFRLKMWGCWPSTTTLPRV